MLWESIFLTGSIIYLGGSLIYLHWTIKYRREINKQINEKMNYDRIWRDFPDD